MVTNKNIYPLMEDVMEDLACTVAKINQEVKLLCSFKKSKGWDEYNEACLQSLENQLISLWRAKEDLQMLCFRLKRSEERQTFFRSFCG